MQTGVDNSLIIKARNILIFGIPLAAILFKDALLILLASFAFKFGLLAAGAMVCFVVYKMSSKPKLKKSLAHGSAECATLSDLIAYKWAYQLEDLGQPIGEAGAFVLSRGTVENKACSFELPRSETCRGILILGPNGSGKSRGFYMWNLAFSHSFSFICLDMKKEMWKMTSGYHEAKLFEPMSETGNTLCFNWIPLCGTDNFLTNLLATAVVQSYGKSKDPFWDLAEISYLSALFAHAATFDSPTPAAMYDFLVASAPDDLIEAFQNSPSKIARDCISLFLQAGDNVKGNTVMSLGSKLQWLGDERVRRFTSSSTAVYDFSQLRQVPVGLYFVINETATQMLKPLTGLFFTYFLYCIKQREDLPARLPVTLFFDEFGNYCIPSMPDDVTIVRAQDISIQASLQSFAQLSKQYGDDAEAIFKDNFVTKIILGGLDSKSAEEISRSLGEFTFQEETTSLSESDSGKSKTTSVQKNARRLMTADEIRRLPEDKCIIISGVKKPVILPKNYFNFPANTHAEPAKLGKTLTFKSKRFLQASPERRQITATLERKRIGSGKRKALKPSPQSTRKLLPPMPEFPKELEQIDYIDAVIIEDKVA